MVSTLEDFGIDLFGSEALSLGELRKLDTLINCSEKCKIDFAEHIEANKRKKLQAGIGLVMLGKNAEAVKLLEKAKDCKEKYLYMGTALRNLRQYDESVASFDNAAKEKADSLLVGIEKAETLRVAGKIKEAAKALKGCGNFEKVSAEYHFELGRICDSQGEYEKAMNNYKMAIELDAGHQKALFHLAYSCDLRGDDEAAMDYYKQIKSNNPVYVNALLNLAVLYEDKNQYDKASKCVDMVLFSHPNHQKALLFSKDVESSKFMIYDEEKEKMRTRHHQTLEIPISDFELSVRSRNCLKKMNIYTIGDLLNISEAELLSYKNFGETSLTEIKQILDQKSLTLGMSLEEKGAAAADIEITGENQELLNMPCQEMELSVRARRCLQRLGCKNIAELISKTEAELLGCKNFGVTSLNEIKDRLTSYGLSLRTLE
ncbi:MAG: tetratricopeptide repeat protein [Planctomycetes bacterium]|nr:tetratricopeptide repeat protein [Planctomycetota bacterium]